MYQPDSVEMDRLNQKNDSVNITCRGIARNLLWGTKEGAGGEVPQQGPGAEPRWGVGQSPQKPETHAEYSTEQNT